MKTLSRVCALTISGRVLRLLAPLPFFLSVACGTHSELDNNELLYEDVSASVGQESNEPESSFAEVESNLLADQGIALIDDSSEPILCPFEDPNCAANRYCYNSCTPSSNCFQPCDAAHGGPSTCGVSGQCAAPCANVCNANSDCNRACASESGWVTTCGNLDICDPSFSVSREKRVKKGGTMRTSVTYRVDSGRVSGRTEVRNSNSFSGYTGGLIVAFVNRDGIPLHMIPLKTWGINHCGWRCPKRRHINWSATVPAEHRAEIVGIALVQDHTPTKRFGIWALKIIKSASFLVAKGVNLAIEAIDPDDGANPGRDKILTLIITAAVSEGLERLEGTTREDLERTLASMLERINQEAIYFR